MISRLPPGIRAVFTDLDGTLTRHSSSTLTQHSSNPPAGPPTGPQGAGVEASTLRALEQLYEAGYWVAVVTGRPAGWADCIARLWPVHSVVFENGAGFYHHSPAGLVRHDLAAAQNTPFDREQLQRLLEQLQTRFPQARLAQDQPYRLFDFAIDHSESKPAMKPDEAKRLLLALRATPNITASPSSTHINYLFGPHNKATGAKALLDAFGASFGVSPAQVLYVGDSLNDEPAFAFFDHSVGVANVHMVLDLMSSHPKQITEKPGGKGFEEIASRLLTP